jgi:CheY-like chemotaxis protein
MLTSLGEGAARAEGLPQWVERVLVKPVRQAELAGALQNVISVSGQRTLNESGATSVHFNMHECRLLLVEDSLLNQEVMTDMLSALGLTADIANNGREALAMLEKSQYPLILMDCQMPVLDGYEATRELRRREHQNGTPRTPVIAVTAHAFADERDKVLRAGMDDYLTKPVQLAGLRSLVDRWLGDTSILMEPATHSDANAAPVSVAESPRAATPVAPTANGNERLLLNPATRRTPRMRELFTTESPKDIVFIMEAEVAGEIEMLRERAHRLKGAAFAFGAEQLGDLAAEIEREAKAGQTDYGTLTSKLERLYDETVAELDQLSQLGRSP